MQKNPQASTITLTDSPVKPEISLNEANKFGIEELIGEGQSNYTHSIPERIYNVSLAASKFNGVIIEKGKVLSFNDIVGDISSSTGYKPAYVIKNGRTVLGDGGGVCQVSTTLFRAALNTGLPILERTAHAYRVGYYENDAKPGLDATVFGPYVDLKIKNDTTAAILLEVENDEENKILKFKIYGKKDGRLAEISPIRITDEQAAPPPVYQDDPTLKKGVVKQVDFAASGAKSTFTYKIHRADKSTEEKTFVSVYRPWAAVYLVGQAD
jgi:vancomycin resistance protein YoaR